MIGKQDELMRKTGEKQLMDGAYEDAIETYNKMIMGSNININDLNMLGVAYARNNEFEKAKIIFSEIFSALPDHRIARNNFMEVSHLIVQQSNETDEKKIIALEEILCISPDCFTIVDTLTKLCTKSGMKLKALMYGQMSVKLKPDDVDTRNQLGQIYFSLGRKNDALNEFRFSLKMQPDNDDTKRYVNEVEKDIDRYEKYIGSGLKFNIGIVISLCKTITEVCEGVFIGTQYAAGNLNELKGNGITHILNVSAEVPNYFEGVNNEFTYKKEAIIDNLTYDIVGNGVLDGCLNFIEKAVGDGNKVLVHCQAGISRSGAIVVAYIMRKFELDYDTALKKAREKRNCINPNKSFESQIRNHITNKKIFVDVFECGQNKLSPTHQEKSAIRCLFDDLYDCKNIASNDKYNIFV